MEGEVRLAFSKAESIDSGCHTIQKAKANKSTSPTPYIHTTCKKQRSWVFNADGELLVFAVST